MRFGHVPFEVRLLEKAFITDAPEDGRTTLEVGDGPVFERRWGHKATCVVYDQVDKLLNYLLVKSAGPY